MITVFKIIFLCIISNVAISQEKSEINELKLSKLPIGTSFSFDGKTLSKFQSNCPATKLEKTINGKEVIIEEKIDSISVSRKKLGCGPNGLHPFQRQFVITGQIPHVKPLICLVERVETSDKFATIKFARPCDFTINGNRAIFDFRDAGDMTVGSLLYNLGLVAEIKIDINTKSANINYTSQPGKEVPISNKSNSSDETKVRAQ